MNCKVSECRFYYTHTTAGHMCGTCFKFGHGQLECHNVRRKAILKENSKNDVLPLDQQCQLPFCQHKSNHTTDAHHCFKCKKRDQHAPDECIIQDYDTCETRFNLENRFDKDTFIQEVNSYVVIRLGLGCSMYVKKYQDKLVGLFMHQDSWGQYGPNSDDRPIMYRFIHNLDEKPFEDYEIVQNQSDSYQCPLCKSDNMKSDAFEIKGSTDECKICMDQTVEIYFPECKHACCCKECFQKL